MSACSVSGTSRFSSEPATRSVSPSRASSAAVEQHAHRLDRVERDPVRTPADLRAHVVGQARDEPVEQRVHRVVGERLQDEARSAAAVHAEVGPALEQLRAGQRERRRSASRATTRADAR